MSGARLARAIVMWLLVPSFALAKPTVCALVFERILAVSAAIEKAVDDPVLTPRWIRRATLSLYERELHPRVEPLLKKPGREWTVPEAALALEVELGMNDNPFLRDHADRRALEKRRAEWASWTSFAVAPLEQIAHANRAKKGWERLSSKSKSQGALALDEIRQNPQVGTGKTSFPNRIRFHKFFTDGVTYIVAYEMKGKDVYLHALGPHENFYDGVSDLRE